MSEKLMTGFNVSKRNIKGKWIEEFLAETKPFVVSTITES